MQGGRGGAVWELSYDYFSGFGLYHRGWRAGGRGRIAGVRAGHVRYRVCIGLRMMHVELGRGDNISSINKTGRGCCDGVLRDGRGVDRGWRAIVHW